MLRRIICTIGICPLYAAAFVNGAKAREALRSRSLKTSAFRCAGRHLHWRGRCRWYARIAADDPLLRSSQRQ
jgi:hypothetical protein